jgi:predicted dehydrogenase
MKTANIGIIGGGLMGKEMASAFARWCALSNVSVTPVLTAVCDLNPAALQWFERIPSVTQLTNDIDVLLANKSVDIVYVALPHHLHKDIYLKVIESGKDLFAEKPFGIDQEAAQSIVDAAEAAGTFVRCSSEFRSAALDRTDQKSGFRAHSRSRIRFSSFERSRPRQASELETT